MSKKATIILTIMVIAKRKLAFKMCDCKAKHPHAYLMVDGQIAVPIPFFDKMQAVDFLLQAVSFELITDEEHFQLVSELATIALPFRF